MESPVNHHSSQFAKIILDSLTAHVAIIDKKGFILETNRAWKQFARQNQLRMRPEAQDVNYLEICDSVDVQTDEGGSQVARGIRDVIAGRIEEFVLDYPCHSPDEKRWFLMRVTRASGPGSMRIVVSHENITILRQTENRLLQNQKALQLEKEKLEEANTALKVILQRLEANQREMEADILDNVHRLIRPLLIRLTELKLPKSAKELIASVDERLSIMTRPFLRRLSNVESMLTPQEIEVASLVREGKSSKEIAARLNLSITTIHFHRRNLRRKLKLNNTTTNLRIFLMGLEK